MRDKRLELLRLAAMDFKSTASAYSANPALVAVDGYAPSSPDYKSGALLLCYTALKKLRRSESPQHTLCFRVHSEPPFLGDKVVL